MMMVFVLDDGMGDVGRVIETRGMDCGVMFLALTKCGRVGSNALN